MSDAEGDTNSEITTKNLKKKVVEEAKQGRDAPANEGTNEKNGDQNKRDWDSTSTLLLQDFINHGHAILESFY